MTRTVEINGEQARLIRELDMAVKVAQGQFSVGLRAVLAGCGAEGAEVLSMNADRDPPVLVIKDPGADAGKTDGAEQSTNENARAAALR